AASGRRGAYRGAAGRQASHHFSLKPAVTLLAGALVPASVTAVVTLSVSNSFCSTLTVLCVMLSRVELVELAASVVLVEITLNFTTRSVLQTCAGVVEASGAPGTAAAAPPGTVSVSATVFCNVTEYSPPIGSDGPTVVPNRRCSRVGSSRASREAQPGTPRLAQAGPELLKLLADGGSGSGSADTPGANPKSAPKFSLASQMSGSGRFTVIAEDPSNFSERLQSSGNAAFGAGRLER